LNGLNTMLIPIAQLTVRCSYLKKRTGLRSVLGLMSE